MKSKIEWCDYTINPVKGLCPMVCPYCYARRMYKRFKWNPNIRADWQETGKLPNKPSRIFVGSTMELFGEWIKPEWMEEIFKMVKRYPQHTFIFLTKQPQNLIKWSPFPDNCWVGVSWIGDDESRPLRHIVDIKAPVKFISFEPLLEFCHWWTSDLLQQSFIKAGINWVIIGAQTPYSKKTAPRIEWVKEIVDAADKAKIPVFLKNNLIKLWGDDLFYPEWAMNKTGFHFRQELPERGK